MTSVLDLSGEVENTATRISPQEQKGCACLPWTDAITCWDLHYYGYSPVRRGPASYDWTEERGYTLMGGNDDDGECECVCHDDLVYDDDDSRGA
jgi:hypothetical protein